MLIKQEESNFSEISILSSCLALKRNTLTFRGGAEKIRVLGRGGQWDRKRTRTVWPHEHPEKMVHWRKWERQRLLRVEWMKVRNDHWIWQHGSNWCDWRENEREGEGEDNNYNQFFGDASLRIEQRAAIVAWSHCPASYIPCSDRDHVSYGLKN